MKKFAQFHEVLKTEGGVKMYDPKSKCADNFINHEEIMDTLAFAERIKGNEALIREILEEDQKA